MGRVLVGIDEQLNRVRGFRQGFFSMFECIDDEEAVRALFDASLKWLKEKRHGHGNRAAYRPPTATTARASW